jgi:hypothetical protein
MYTKELIPIVTEKHIIEMHRAFAEGSKDRGYLDRLYTQIGRENPAVFDFFGSCTKEGVHFEENADFGGAFLVYWLLRSRGETLLFQRMRPALPEGCYTREGLPIVKPIRFTEWANAVDDISEDEDETVGTLTAEMWVENTHLEDHIERFAKSHPSESQNDLLRNASVLYLSMKRQSALYIAGAENFE